MKTRPFVVAAAGALTLFAAAPAIGQAPAPVDLQSVPPLSGSWGYRAVAGGSEADFIDAAASVQLKIRCNRAARTVSVVRPSVPAAAPTLTIWTTSLSRSVPARFLPSRELVADIASTDSLLDAMSFSVGRFATAAAGAPMVALPAGPEATRVIEDCRS